MSKAKLEAGEKVENEKWTTQMDAILIEAFVHQLDIGNKVNGSFTSTAYDNVVKELKEKLVRDFSKQHLKNRLKTIKKNFNVCNDIFKGGMSGFAWNPLTCMWNAEPEVWSSFIESKPEAKKWMKTPMPNYDKLLKLYGEDRATGAGAETAKEKARRWEQEGGVGGRGGALSLEDIDTMVSTDFSVSVNDEQTSEATSSAPNKSTSSSNSKKRKAEEEHKLVEAMDNFSCVVKEGNEIFKKIVENAPPVYKEKDIYDELKRLGFEEETFYKGYTFLVENHVKARGFFGFPSEERVQILLFQLCQAGLI